MAHILPDSLVGSLVGSKYWISFAKKYLIYFYNKANLIFAVSPEVKNELLKLGITAPIKSFPLSLDDHLFSANEDRREKMRAEWNIKKDEKVLIGVGQIQSRKGIVDFIEIAKKLPEYTFLWLGSIPFGNLTAQSEDLKQHLLYPPSNFRLITTIFSYEDMPASYNAADIFLFPSYQETFGLVVIEAASCGLPVILRDLPVYENTFKNNYLKAKTISEFIDKIKSLMSEKTYEEYVKKSKNIATDFSNQENSLRLATYYKHFLSGEKI
jgi:1,2-diacylglycerol-3-alpha-glucose alpha-1,2-galactosyltransferase